MTTILIRTFIIYTTVIIAMRIMGKRQIGELEVSDLVTTLMLSEIATMPIENQDIPIMNAIIPIISLLTIEVISSVALIKIPKLKSVFSARPSILIRNGVLNQKELEKNRISLEELMCELRAENCIDPEEVSYAILEKNGKLTVIPKSRYSPPTSNDMNVKVKERGMIHLLVIDGKVCENNLLVSGKSYKWLEGELKALPCKLSDIYVFGVDDSEKTIFIKKDKK